MARLPAAMALLGLAVAGCAVGTTGGAAVEIVLRREGDRVAWVDLE